MAPSPAEMRSDVFAFAEAIGLPLTRWQSDSLALRRRTTVIVSGRQTGKSRTLAVLALWWCFRSPEQHALLVSAGEDASRRLLSMCAGAATTSPLLRVSLVDETAAELKLSNGSTIRSVPSSEKAIRGHSIDLLLLDEMAQLEDDLVLSAALPTTAARPGAKIVLAGSAGPPEGTFFHFANAGDTGDEHVETFRWALTDATWVEPSVIAAAKAQLPDAAFRREYLGEFAAAGADERVISREWIAEAQQRELAPGSAVVLACDVARKGGDETVVIRMAGQVARVVHAQRGADLMALSSKLAQLSRDERGPAPTLALDGTGMGIGVFDRLVQMQVPVAAFIASARAPDPSRFLNMRAFAWWSTREAFRTGQLDIDPRDRELADQLASATYGLTPAGQIQIGDKSKLANSPDRADALTIAVWACSVHARGEQIARLAEQSREAASRRQPVLAEEALAGPATEELWSRPRERIVDSDLPIFDGVWR